MYADARKWKPLCILRVKVFHVYSHLGWTVHQLMSLLRIAVERGYFAFLLLLEARMMLHASVWCFQNVSVCLFPVEMSSIFVSHRLFLLGVIVPFARALSHCLPAKKQIPWLESYTRTHVWFLFISDIKSLSLEQYCFYIPFRSIINLLVDLYYELC